MKKSQQLLAILIEKFSIFYGMFKTNTDVMNDEEKKFYQTEKFALMMAGFAALIFVMYQAVVPTSPQEVALTSESSHESLTVASSSSIVSVSTGDGVGGAGGEDHQGEVDEGGGTSVGATENEDPSINEEAGLCSSEFTCDSEI